MPDISSDIGFICINKLEHILLVKYCAYTIHVTCFLFCDQLTSLSSANGCLFKAMHILQKDFIVTSFDNAALVGEGIFFILSLANICAGFKAMHSI